MSTAAHQAARSYKACGASSKVASSSSAVLSQHARGARCFSTTQAFSDEQTTGQQIASALGGSSVNSDDPAKAHLSAIEALRRAISRNQDRASRGSQEQARQRNRTQHRKYDGAGLEGRKQEGNARRGGGSNRGEGREEGGVRGRRQGQGQGDRRGSPRQGGQRRQREKNSALDTIRSNATFLAEEAATVATDVRPMTDWAAAPSSSVAFTKVPYAVPSTSFETLNPNLDKKAQHPYASTAPLLKFDTYPVSSNTTLRGQQADTVPFARPGRSESDRVRLQSADEQPSGSSTSIAAAAQEVRRQTIREEVGGDYVRWTRQAIYDARKHSSGVDKPLDKQIARALALNSDLGPSLKHWTMSEVQNLLSRTGALKGGASQQRPAQ